MNYEKKYKEALERAREIHNEHKAQPFDVMLKVFPELAESEDERIRKAIRLILIATQDDQKDFYETHKLTRKELTDWLEKQGEKPQGKSALEAIKEENVDNANKVEPKFKVGDWIVSETSNLVYHVDSILYPQSKRYYLSHNGSTVLVNFADAKNYRLWTIQDAKDGDVLVGSKGDVILMFRGIGNTEWDDVIDYHCYYDCYRGDFIVQKDVDYWGYTENNQLEPATKEQRDLLFQKMKEAGYEWDAEKKELKKIINEKQIKKNLQDNSFRRIFEQKPEWSEEDETILNGICDDIQISLENTNIEQLKTIYEKELNWLKSLRPQNKYAYNPYKVVVESIAEMCKHYDKASHSGLRDFYDNIKVKCKDAKEYDSLYNQNTWKPSKEQIIALRWVLNNMPCNKHKEKISGLLDQIKDL